MRGRGLAVVALLAGVAACGGAAAPTPLDAPPVAAVAPPLTATPAGRVLDLGVDRPEGIAVSGEEVVLDTQGSQLVVLSLSGAVTARDTLPGSGRHVRVSDGLALIPSEGTGQLAVVTLATGLVRAVTVGRAPHDVVPIPGDRALVGDEADGAVSVVDLATLTTTATLPAGLQPGGLAADGGYAAAVDVRGRYLYRYDVTGPVRSDGRVAVGAGPTHVVDLGGGLVAVADAIGHAVDVVSLPRLRVVARIAVPGAPEGLAADLSRHRLWVTLPGSDQLLEVVGDEVARTYATVRQANSVAVDPAGGTVYVAGATTDATLQILMP